MSALLTATVVLGSVFTYSLVGVVVGAMHARYAKAVCPSRRHPSECEHGAAGFFVGLLWPVLWTLLVGRYLMNRPTVEERRRSALEQIARLEKELGIRGER